VPKSRRVCVIFERERRLSDVALVVAGILVVAVPWWCGVLWLAGVLPIF